MAYAAPGDTVAVHYTGRLDDGRVFDASEGRDPLTFTLGSGQVIAGFDQAVDGMAVGERKTVRIPAAEAYGERHDERVLSIPRADLPDGLEVEIGTRLQMMATDGRALPVTVVGHDDENVTLDANPPLAGEALTFELTLVAVG